MDNLTFTVIAVALTAQVYFSTIPEVPTLKYVVSYCVGNVLLFTSLVFPSLAISQLLIRFTTLNTAFLFTVTCLTLIRRLYFSPLSNFPGPRAAALSKLWEANEFRQGVTSFTLQALHKEYNSDFIRTGPNELSISNVDAVEKIYKGKYKRGPFYELGMMNGEFNLNTTRNNADHSPWRRIWNKAFTPAEIKEYNPRVEHHVSKLVEIIRKSNGKEVNFTKLMDRLVFDIMVDLSFADDAGMQDGTGDPTYSDFLHKYVFAIGILGSLRNLSQLLVLLPENEEVRAFRLKGEALLAKRQAMGTSRKDVFSHLLQPDTQTGRRFNQKELNTNANLIIAAGADTTSNVMSQIFRFLALDQESKNAAGQESIISKLRREVDAICDKGVELTPETIRNAKYLDGVVFEALRLMNPLPMGVQAVTPPQGLEIAGRHIPGHVAVRAPPMLLMSDDRYFPSATEFIPERWTGERPELLTDLSWKAYIPFGYGVHSCVGKNLALNELRLVIAKLVREFDVSFGESYDDDEFKRETKDYIILESGPVWLKFKPRFQ